MSDDPKRDLAIEAAEAIDPSFAGHAMDVARQLDPTIAQRESAAAAQSAANRQRAEALIASYAQALANAAPRTSAELAELTSLLLNDGA